jgi:hypothetical protein
MRGLISCPVVQMWKSVSMCSSPVGLGRPLTSIVLPSDPCVAHGFTSFRPKWTSMCSPQRPLLPTRSTVAVPTPIASPFCPLALLWFYIKTLLPKILPDIQLFCVHNSQCSVSSLKVKTSPIIFVFQKVPLWIKSEVILMHGKLSF